jgi:hypothetical protein
VKRIHSSLLTKPAGRIVRTGPILLAGLVLVARLGCPSTARAQQSPQAKQTGQDRFLARFFAHNYAMTALEPSWPTPLVETDPRLTQYYRFAFSNEYTPAGTQTVNYGNSRGGGIVAWNRIQVDWLPPSYIQHNSSATDGFGDTSVLAKYRIASANADHGNYILTAVLSHTFASSPHNGALTDSWTPTLAGGIGFLRHFDVESALGGLLPTGRIAAQGRTIMWNSLVQDHVARPVFLEIENNATFYVGGSHDGKMQNFITPAAYYIYKKSDWKPQHWFLVFAGGMQIATSQFHTYNHNTIAEMRILF